MAKTTEAGQILKRSPLDRVLAFHKINKDEDTKKELIGLLREILALSQTQIARSAGGVKSMDTMIDTAVNQAFYRGRISSVVLVNKLIEGSSAELEMREERRKRKK